MKVRNGFVSNSSSSSFVIITAGKVELLSNGDTSCEETNSIAVKIDELIEKLEEAKAAGETEVIIAHGGGFNG